MGIQTDPPLMPSAVHGYGKRRWRRHTGASAAPGRLQRFRPKIEQFCREHPRIAICLGIGVGLLLRTALGRVLVRH